MPSVLITNPPAGQAPLWVREAWVGLPLPTDDQAPRSWQATGVLDGRGILGWLMSALPGRSYSMSGFQVPSAKAIAILAQAAPSAAEWWRKHAPDFLRPEATFLFEEEVCHWRNEP